jgi:hypothetical protein
VSEWPDTAAGPNVETNRSCEPNNERSRVSAQEGESSDIPVNQMSLGEVAVITGRGWPSQEYMKPREPFQPNEGIGRRKRPRTRAVNKGTASKETQQELSLYGSQRAGSTAREESYGL